jgi:hypothetical protein
MDLVARRIRSQGRGLVQEPILNSYMHQLHSTVFEKCDGVVMADKIVAPGSVLDGWTRSVDVHTETRGYLGTYPIEGQPSRQAFNLWEQTLGSSEPRQLTKFPDPIFVHACSRDGKQLAVLTGKFTSDIVLIREVR